MNAVVREYVAKGVFLGLWAYLALLQPDWPIFWRVVAWTGGGFALALIVGAILHLVRGLNPLRNLPGFLLLVLLDNAFVIYIGLIGGLAIGLLMERPAPVDPELTQAVAGAAVSMADNPVRDWLGYFALGGALLGYGFFQLTQIRDQLYRLGLGVVIGAAVIYLAVHYLNLLPMMAELATQQRFAAYLLIGLPFFYVLTFCGDVDESEVEIAALCAALGVGLYLLRLSSNLPEYGDKLIFLIPLLVYFIYVTRYQPTLRVFKHVLRGYGNLSTGRVRDALAGFGRALQLDSRSALARQGLWELHRRIDVSALDESTIRLLNFDFCLDLAEKLLIKDRAPTEGERTESSRMLDLVERYKPDQLPRADYLRAVSLTHGRRFDEAAGYLARLLNPETPYAGERRKAILFRAWDLALRLHPEIVARLGEHELAKPGRRIEAIGAVERLLAQDPEDATAGELRRTLYAGLSESEFAAAAATEAPTDFNYEFVEQLGLALVGETDPAQIERGMSYLRIAGRGLSQRAPVLFATLADLATKLGRSDEARGYLEQVKRAGLVIGPTRLPADQKEVYLKAIQSLATEAEKAGDFASAVDDYRLYVEAGKEDVNTLRRLAELYAKNRDPLNALLITERGLLYAKADPDLLAKKDSYYFSVTPEQIAGVKDRVASWFDVDFCLKRAKAVAGQKELDAETAEYGLHMLRLAKILKPESQSVRFTEARLLLRQGQRDAALTILEDLREEKKGSGEDEDAWYLASKIAGDLYLDELGRPDLAVLCYNDFRDYQGSGADTLYHLGRAYEALGKYAEAVQSYQMVTAYQNHPRYWDATEAVRRLKENRPQA